MANLFPPPKVFDLPLVKGQDVVVDFKNKVPDSSPVTYTDYGVGVTVKLIIDVPEDDPIIATAVIATHHATCRIESDVSDDLKKGYTWRCVVSFPGAPTTERVPCNGVTVRYDGKT